MQNVPKIISSRRSPIKKHQKQQQQLTQSADQKSGAKQHVAEVEEEEEARPMVEPAATKFCGMLQATARVTQVTSFVNVGLKSLKNTGSEVLTSVQHF